MIADHEHSFTKVEPDQPAEDQCEECLRLWADEQERRILTERKDAEQNKRRERERLEKWVQKIADLTKAVRDGTSMADGGIVAALIIADAIDAVEKRLDGIEDRLVEIRDHVEPR